MSIKLMFEIGHTASLKTKPSKEGFTHDWELFVRGPGTCDIPQFVDKVVFNLHESFPKPKRPFKDPPYVVKECGYAGFVLTIDIYLKNRDEPKKVTFEYDLDLQPYKTQMNEFIIATPSDEFKRKCLKGGGLLLNSDYKNPYGKNPQLPPMNEAKKSSKRPEETKPNKQFTDLFGAPLKKPDPRSLQNASPNPTKLPSSGKGGEKPSTTSVSGGKDKGEKSKHKHSPNKDGKEAKKTSEGKQEPEKSKKEKTKDRERSGKKEKVSKRPSSPSPNSMPGSSSSSSVRNSTNLSSLPPSKTDLVKPPSKQSSTPVPPSDMTFTKKSSKKDKKEKSEKERERTDKKDSRVKESFTSKEKAIFESQANKPSNAPAKERDSTASKDEREKTKQAKVNSSAATEPKTTPTELTKKHEKDSERKHKHKKKEKTKEKDVTKEKDKKEKPHKNSVNTASPAKSKEPVIPKYEPPSKSHLSDNDSSDSDVDSPPSIKQYSDNSMPEPIIQRPPPEAEKPPKKSRDRVKTAEKDDKSRNKRKSKKEERSSSASPPPAKQSKKDISKSPAMQDRPSSSDSAAHSHTNNNNNEGVGKISNEYMSELKDLKQKITTLKNNDDLQSVVRLIAATGCYEITKSSFDFDLVQLDRSTVQRLQEFFAAS